MLAHKAIIPVLNAILGKGFRMDHSPDVIIAKPGAEGHRLHGGMIPFNPAGYYMFSRLLTRLHLCLILCGIQGSDTPVLMLSR